MDKVLFTQGKSDEWSTPLDVFNKLNDEFNFTLDPCASDQNHLCDRYYTMADNGLEKDWGGTCVLQSTVF